eukprot:315036_1
MGNRIHAAVVDDEVYDSMFAVDDTLDQRDILLGKYYSVMGRNDYYDDNGIGKFKSFCHDDNNIMAGFADIDSNFPLTQNIEYDDILDQKEKEEMIKMEEKEIFKIVKYLFDNFVDNITYVKRQLNWNNIRNIIEFEFDKKTCKVFKNMIDENKESDDYIPTKQEFKDTLNKFQKKNNLSED